MIYSNPDKSRLPNLEQAMSLLTNITHRFPVLHRSPESIISNDPEVSILTYGGKNCALRPNISCQGAVFGWHNDYDRLRREIMNPEAEDVSHQKESQFRIFERLLESHPFFALLKEGISVPGIPYPISICNPAGLALSYDLYSTLIPFSSSLQIAAFHASTEYDPFTNTFRQIGEGRTGVIFVFELYERFSLIKNLKVVGKQPFQRPGLNKLFALDIGHIRNLVRLPNVKGFLFRQNENAGRRIFEMFDEGRSLSPDEPIVRKVNQIIALNGANGGSVDFSQRELEREWFHDAPQRCKDLWKKTIFPRFRKYQEEYILDIPNHPNYRKFFNPMYWYEH